MRNPCTCPVNHEGELVLDPRCRYHDEVWAWQERAAQWERVAGKYRAALEEIARGETRMGYVNEPTVLFVDSVLRRGRSAGSAA